MTNLGLVLGRLGLDQYQDALIEEGFDTWETVLDIQETDLWVTCRLVELPPPPRANQPCRIALNFKLGHRRVRVRPI
jgi:hypothetical protein